MSAGPSRPRAAAREPRRPGGLRRLRPALSAAFDGPLGAFAAALALLLVWRAVMHVQSALQGAVGGPLFATMTFLAVAAMALGPVAAAVALRPRRGWSSAAAHAAGFAASAALHLALWAAVRGGLFGDPGFFDRGMLLLVGGVAAVTLASHGHTLQAEGRLRWPEAWVRTAGAVAGGVALALASALPAAAHTPAFAPGAGTWEEPVLLPGPPGASWAVLQRIPADRPAVFAALLGPGDAVVASLVTPAAERYAGFHPALAVVGPGLPPPAEPLPVPVPPGHGALVARDWSGRGWEGFTEIPLFLGPEVRSVAVAAGEYRFAVWDPAGGGGEVWFAPGAVERFGPADLHPFAAAYLELRLRFW